MKQLNVYNLLDNHTAKSTPGSNISFFQQQGGETFDAAAASTDAAANSIIEKRKRSCGLLITSKRNLPLDHDPEIEQGYIFALATLVWDCGDNVDQLQQISDKWESGEYVPNFPVRNKEQYLVELKNFRSKTASFARENYDLEKHVPSLWSEIVSGYKKILIDFEQTITKSNIERTYHIYLFKVRVNGFRDPIMNMDFLDEFNILSCGQDVSLIPTSSRTYSTTFET